MKTSTAPVFGTRNQPTASPCSPCDPEPERKRGPILGGLCEILTLVDQLHQEITTAENVFNPVCEVHVKTPDVECARQASPNSEALEKIATAYNGLRGAISRIQSLNGRCQL